MNSILRFRSLGILMFLGMIAVFSVAAMFLWNVLMPELFALPVLSYGQAAGLVVLARILFGGLGPGRLGPHIRGGDDRLFQHGNVLREKWLNMTEDERKEFVRSRGGFSHFHEFFDERFGGGSSAKDAPKNEGGKCE